MKNIQLADVVVHIDETLPGDRRADIETRIRSLDGVISVHNPDDRPHLAVVQYNPEKASSGGILDLVRQQGVHAELIGL